MISESSAHSNFNKHEQNIVFPPPLIPWNGSSIFIETFPRNSAWRRHPAWKISAQTAECWQHNKQLKQSYNGKCCTTFHIGGNIIQRALAVVANIESHKKSRGDVKIKKSLFKSNLFNVYKSHCPQNLRNQERTEAEQTLTEIFSSYERVLTVSGSCLIISMTHVMMSLLVYHKTVTTHNSKTVLELWTHTPRLRVRVVKWVANKLKIFTWDLTWKGKKQTGSPSEYIFLIMVIRAQGALSSSSLLLQLADVGSYPCLD